MTKEIEKRSKGSIAVKLLIIAAAAGLVRFIVQAIRAGNED